MNVGPFDLMQLIIGAVVIVVVGIAMFLLKGMLSVGITLPIWILVIVLVTILVVIFLLVSTIMGYLRFGQEGFLFATARKKGLGVYIDAELGSEVAEFVLAEKASAKDVVLKDEESGIKVDPGLLSAEARPMRFPRGLDVYIYSYYNFMPQTIRNHAAFQAIKHYFDTQCKELNFLSVKEFVELISDPEHYLERNSLIKLNKYFKLAPKMEIKKNELGQDVTVQATVINDQGEQVPKYTYVRQFQTIDETTGMAKWMEQDISLPDMLQLIAKARRDVSILPVLGGLLAGNEAFKHNSVPYSSQHLGHVLMLYYTKMMDELKAKVDLLTYGIVALMILIGGAVCIYVISMAFGKGAGG